MKNKTHNHATTISHKTGIRPAKEQEDICLRHDRHAHWNRKHKGSRGKVWRYSNEGLHQTRWLMQRNVLFPRSKFRDTGE